MKKLFTLALIGAFSTSLISCSNTAGEQIQEPVNQTHQNVSTSKRTMSESQLIENAISLVKNNAEQKNGLSSRRPLDSLIIIEPEEPVNPEEPIYQENGTILCSSNLNSAFGSACVWNSSGNLVRVTWEPRRDLYWLGGHDGGWNYPSDLTPASKTYTGVVVSQCNC